MQLFETFKYLFNRDQPGDWDAICLYFASHKPLQPPVIDPCCAACVCLPLPLPWPKHGSCCRLQSRPRDIWSRYNGGRQTQRRVSWALDFQSVLLWTHLKYVVILVLPMWYCRSHSHMPHAVWSAPRMSEKPPQLSYSYA